MVELDEFRKFCCSVIASTDRLSKVHGAPRKNRKQSEDSELDTLKGAPLDFDALRLILDSLDDTLQRAQKHYGANAKGTLELETLRALKPCDISCVPWALVQTMLSSRKGNFLFELDGSAVCVRTEGVTPHFLLAEHVAPTLHAKVAAVRYFPAKTEEHKEIANCIARLGRTNGKMLSRSGGNNFNASATPVGVIEFVPGARLDSSDAPKILGGFAPNLLKSLGRLAALDALLNNAARALLPIWDDGPGDLSTLVVASDEQSIVGMGQAVNPIDDVLDVQTYFARLRYLAAQVTHPTTTTMISAISFKIRRAIFLACGVSLQNQSLALILQGVKDGFTKIADDWENGVLVHRLEKAEELLLSNFKTKAANAATREEIGRAHV